METLPCGHAALVGSSRMCRHLLSTEGEEHVRLLTGHGLNFDLCCPACDRAALDGSGQPPELFAACEGCVARCVDDDWSTMVAWRGEPGSLDRPEPLDPTVLDVPLPVAVVDLAPVAVETRSVWLLLTDDGRIGRFDADTVSWTVLAQASVPDEPDHQPWAGHLLRRRLHACSRGRFAAVVNDFGRYGQVVDLATGAATIALHGGDYHKETVPFSLAFVEHNGHTVVIHRTDWNRLDITDAASGQLLTERHPTRYGRDEPLPEHYLDYFHGALYPSPQGRWLADDGWVWHPVGVPCAWDLRSWLADNVWESEDGPSRQRLCFRDYHWNTPMCWTGANLLAVSGIGTDDDAMLAGVRIFDVSTGAEVTRFAGPTGPLFADAHRLYAATPDRLEVWDPVAGERTGTVAGFVPIAHHPGAGELVAIGDGALRRWATPADA